MPSPAFVLGYYADWTGLAPSQIDYRLFTHLCHAFAVVHRDGKLAFPEERQSRDLCSRAHAAGARVLLSVGGAESGPAFAIHTANAAGVARVADRLVTESVRRGYDGIDIDWEFPENADEAARMNALVHALRDHLPTGVTISMAAPAENWSGQWFLKDALLPALDFVNVMTYDFHGSWSDRAGYAAPLYASPGDPDTKPAGTGDGAMKYWLESKSWPPEKLLLGIPLYGTGFFASRWGEKPSRKFPESTDRSYNACRLLLAQGWTRTFDMVSQTPTLRSPDGTQLVSYEDADSAKAKGAYAARRGLGGIFFWEIANDFDGRTNPLVRAARDSFR